MADTEPGMRQVMSAHVAQAVRALNDGAVVVQVLEDLWRAALAAGVRQGRDAARRDADEAGRIRNIFPSGLLPGEKVVRVPSGPVPASGSRPVQNVPGRGRDDWFYALGAIHMNRYTARPGVRFRYGGQETNQPEVDRPAVALTKGAAVKMVLLDTSETVPWPAGAFWARDEEDEKHAACGEGI